MREGGSSQNVATTFRDFAIAEISSVCSGGRRKIPVLHVRLRGRDGERDAEERGEGMGWREKERAQQLAPFFFFAVIIPGRCFSQPHLMKVK